MANSGFKFIATAGLVMFLCLKVTPGYAEAPEQTAPSAEKILMRQDIEAHNAIRWKTLDPKGAGKVTFDEFLNNGFQLQEDASAERKAEFNTIIRKAFEAYDADNDGIVTLPEYNTYHARRFGEIDTNKDNALSEEEILHDKKQHQPERKEGK